MAKSVMLLNLMIKRLLVSCMVQKIAKSTHGIADDIDGFGLQENADSGR